LFDVKVAVLVGLLQMEVVLEGFVCFETESGNVVSEGGESGVELA
jgi:hypothetical protein